MTWFRHYSGTTRDEDLALVTRRSGQAIERVVWLWLEVLESAAEIGDLGCFRIDLDDCAGVLGCAAVDLALVMDAFEDGGRVVLDEENFGRGPPIVSGQVVAWLVLYAAPSDAEPSGG